MTLRSRTLFRFAIVLLSLAAVAGCAIGAPEHADGIQNPNGISDDISAVRMTQSNSLKIPDPNLPHTYPHSYLLPRD